MIGVPGSGGALAVVNVQSMQMAGCHFINNRAGAQGGGIWISSGTGADFSIKSCSCVLPLLQY